MKQQKILFLDRDGTLIVEPADQQIDSIEKLRLLPDVIPSLLQLKASGYVFVMVSNQDGLGTDRFPTVQFEQPQQLMLDIFSSQGIHFESILICPHLSEDRCECRKPKVGLVMDYLVSQTIDRMQSYVIGDRETDVQLANNLGIKSIQIGRPDFPHWTAVSRHILLSSRMADVVRHTTETQIHLKINLDSQDPTNIDTGLGFLDHMLEQLAKHAGFALSLKVRGDLCVDDHHTVEDTAIVLGEGLRMALGDKWGIGRYGFVMPMDESLAHVTLDLSGRSSCHFQGTFGREKINDLSTELIPHFFYSFAEALKATLHISVQGENTHHMIESIFKGVGRSLRQAIIRNDIGLPSTKGVL